MNINHFQSVLTLFLSTFVAFLASAPAYAIVGGMDADVLKIPELGRVGRIIHSGGKCTATLIDRTWVLTAAHCVIADDGKPRHPTSMKFYAGHSTGSFAGHAASDEGFLNEFNAYLAGAALPLARVIIHPRYVPNLQLAVQDFDLALLQLRSPIAEVEYAKLGQLHLERSASDAAPGTDFAAVGYENGDIAVERGFSFARGKRLAWFRAARPDFFISDHLMALRGQATPATPSAPEICVGDSGGPLLGFGPGRGLDLIGVASSVKLHDADDGSRCPKTSFARYIDVPRLGEWIAQTVSGATPSLE